MKNIYNIVYVYKYRDTKSHEYRFGGTDDEIADRRNRRIKTPTKMAKYDCGFIENNDKLMRCSQIHDDDDNVDGDVERLPFGRFGPQVTIRHQTHRAGINYTCGLAWGLASDASHPRFKWLHATHIKCHQQKWQQQKKRRKYWIVRSSKSNL